MSYVPFNPNPRGYVTGDCAIRAIARATEQPWQAAYAALTMEGYLKGDLPNANHVLNSYLKKQGFTHHIVPDTCPDCYTVAQFADDHPKGMYVLMLDNHVVAVNDGDWFDAFDSGGEPIDSYWAKEGSF